MKTYEEFRRELMTKLDEGLLQGPVSFGKIEEMAAKEYAKMWIDKATDELNDYGVGFPEAYKRVAALRKQIDEQ